MCWLIVYVILNYTYILVYSLVGLLFCSCWWVVAVWVFWWSICLCFGFNCLICVLIVVLLFGALVGDCWRLVVCLCNCCLLFGCCLLELLVWLGLALIVVVWYLLFCYGFLWLFVYCYIIVLLAFTWYCMSIYFGLICVYLWCC